MAGQIIISNIKTDSDNAFSILANTGAVLFSANLASGITTGIADSSITNAKLAGSITGDKITVGSLAGNVFTANTITGDKIGQNSISSNNIVSVNASVASVGTLPSARLPAGSVLQVVNATYSTQVDTTSTTFTSTGLTATITPKFATSKIAVFTFMPIGRVAGTSNNSGINMQLQRNATGIFSLLEPTLWTGGNLTLRGTFSHNYIDSPATTSATSYTWYISTNASGDSVSANQSSQQSTIILMEIAQ